MNSIGKQRWMPLVSVLGLALLVILVHGQTLFALPVFDDKFQLTPQNILGQYSDLFSGKTRWLSYGTFAWTYGVMGGNWPVFHGQNVVLHALTVVAVFLFLSRLFRDVLTEQRSALPEKQLSILALGGAALFGLHPATVYAVSYLIQRSVVMATLFSVLSLWCLLEARTRKGVAWYITSALLYVLAISSKEHAVLLPLVAVALVFLLRQSGNAFNPRAIKIASVALMLVTIPVIYFYVVKVGGVYSNLFGSAFDQASFQLIDKLSQDYPAVANHAYLLSVFNESYLFFKYLILWVFPLPGWMSVDMREPIPVSLTQFPQVLGPLLYFGYAALAINLLRLGKERGLVGFAMLTPWLLFPTELATVWLQDPFVLYRSYLWMWPIGAILPAIALRLPLNVLRWLGLVVLVILIAASFDRLATFKSEVALWDDVVRYNARSTDPTALGKERAYNERALAFAQKGELEKALADYNAALQLSPRDANVYSNRAAINLLLGRLESAQADIDVALKIDPDSQKSIYNQASLYVKQGEGDKALNGFSQVISAGGAFARDAYGGRAVIYLKRGMYMEALEDLNNALELDPQYSEAYMNRGAANGILGRNKEALADLDAALRLNPNLFDARLNRALILIAFSRPKDALVDAEYAVSIDPQNIKAHLLRAQLYLSQGQVQEGLREYELILKINPKESMAYLNRGEVFLFLKNAAAAKRDLSQACQLGLQAACSKLAAAGL